jgi:hypothetical protein
MAASTIQVLGLALDHKLKKKLIRARNKRNQLIFQHARLHQEERDKQAEADEERSRKKSPENTVEEVAFSAKMQEVKNRITGKKKMAKDRWNRFAGTSGGGGKGR